MGQDSKIEWTHHTANLWHGCTKVHEGCDHCYAETLSHRWGHDIWGNDRPRLLVNSAFPDLKRFQKLAAAAGEKHRVFVGSMMDIFEKSMPLIDSKGNRLMMTTGNLREELFHNITLDMYPNLTFLFLTKRPGNIIKYIPKSWDILPLDNVMYGTSPATQATADNLIEHLVKVPGKHFLSVEPQLEDISLWNWLKHGKIDWVIQGGESGGHKRPFNINWAYKIKHECLLNSVPYFFKQIDKVQPIPADLMIREFPIEAKALTGAIAENQQL